MLLMAALLLCGCAPAAHPKPDGRPPLAAIRSAVSEHGSRMPDGSCQMQRQTGAFLVSIAAPRGGGVRFSLEMTVAGLCHTFTLLPTAPGDACPCAYTVTGGDKPLQLAGSIDTRTYPGPGSVSVDETAGYPTARARELFTQYTPLLLDAVQKMLAACGAGDALHALFPGFPRQDAARV